MSHFNVVSNVIQLALWFGGGDVTYNDGILSTDMTPMREKIKDIKKPTPEEVARSSPSPD